MSLIEGMDDTVEENLKTQAWEESDPFCYNDYIVVQPDDEGNARCPKCGSDDLMRHVSGVGVEYGIEWVMKHLIKTEWESLSESEVEDIVEDWLDELYPNVDIAGVKYSVSQILKNVDPTHFRMVTNDHQDMMIEDGTWIEMDGDIYVVPEEMK